MSILDIRVVPDPVLRRKAKRVSVMDNSIKKLISDMLDTLHGVPGRAGLAAPQVGVPLRVVVIGLPDEQDIVLVNPEVVRRTGEREVTEGCLSIPGYYGTVKRSEKVRVKAQDGNGRELKINADDMLAQALEHEIDHLNGVLYIDRLVSPDDLHRAEPETDDLP
jgi:peptide deformylase